MKREEQSGKAFPIAVFALVMGFFQTALTVLIASVTPASYSDVLGMAVLCFILFGGAAFFYWQHRRDKKYDVLIEQEDQEIERQLQEQVSSQH